MPSFHSSRRLRRTVAKTGRNDLCPCGSGKKFKRCCLNRNWTQNEDHTPRNDPPLLNRNLVLIEALIDILGVKHHDWSEIKRDLTKDQVREFFKLVAGLWPHETKLAPLLPQPDQKLRGLFIGLQRPESILENVLRYSLYSDEIVIVNPFVNPNCIAPKYNPILRPDIHKAQFLKFASMPLQLSPWIASGIVVMMPDPGDFDYPLRKATWDSARERWKGKEPPVG